MNQEDQEVDTKDVKEAKGARKAKGSNAAPQVKLESVLKAFDGAVPFDDWYSKFKLVAKFSGWSDPQIMLGMLVLRLEGSALLVYNQMSEEDQDDFGKVVSKMKSAFMPSVADAHKLLLARRWVQGESPERVWADLVRHWKLSTGLSTVDEQTVLASVKPFYLDALPKAVSRQLRMVGVRDLVDLIERSKELLSDVDEVPQVFGGFGRKDRKSGDKFKGSKPSGRRRCYKCGSNDHLMSECTKPQSVCFKCGKEGHFAKECKQGFHMGGAAQSAPSH